MNNSTFDKSLDTFKRSLAQLIGKKAQQIGKEVCKEVVDTFKEVAGNRLKNRATPAGESISKVDAIANSITTAETEKGAVARIPIDEEGLVMFLEYGTGLAGENSEKPQPSWEYALNRDKYVYYGDREGFVFSKNNKSYQPYIDQSDVVGLASQKATESAVWVKPHERNGKLVKGYARRYTRASNRVNTQAVFSEGLKATRFVYDTKKDIKDILRSSKDVAEVRKQLAEMRTSL